MRTPAATACLVAVAAVLTLGITASGADQAKEPRFYVIVHPSNTASSLDRKFVADAFLKKATRWGNDAAIRPVDQKPRADVRREFSSAVLKRSLAAVRSYWSRIVFSGRGVPPPELEDDAEVVDYVGEHRGAIGYVSSDAVLQGVKVIRVR